MQKYNYNLVFLLTPSLYDTIDFGKNEFRCLFVRVFETLYQSLLSDSCFPCNIVRLSISHYFLTVVFHVT